MGWTILIQKGMDIVITRCILECEVKKVLESCHVISYVAHHGGDRTMHKVLQYGFFWPLLFKDSISYVKVCDKC